MKWLKKVPLNRRNPLQGEELKYVLVSSVQAIRNDAYINSYETGLNPDKRNSLLESYKVLDRIPAEQVLNEFAEEDLQPFFHEMYGLYQKNYPFLEQIIYDQLGSIKAENTVALFHNLSHKIAQLKKMRIINHEEEIKQIHLSVWNNSLGAFIARLMYEEQIISLSELKSYLRRFYKSVKKSVGSWEEFAKSAIATRILYQNEALSKNDIPEKILLDYPDSPFKQIQF